MLDPARDGKPTRYEIKGFYVKDAQDGKNVLPFRVLTEEESKQKEQNFDLPNQLGLIELHVFKQNEDSGDGYRRVSLRGLSPRERQKAKSRSLAEYEKHLREKTGVRYAKEKGVLVYQKKRGRGILDTEPTAQAGGKLEIVNFDNPKEVFFQAYRYHTPGGDKNEDSSFSEDN